MSRVEAVFFAWVWAAVGLFAAVIAIRLGWLWIAGIRVRLRRHAALQLAARRAAAVLANGGP